MAETSSLFAESTHFSITSDPGLHGREDTLGLIVFSPDADISAYGPTVVIRDVPLEECTDQLVLDLLDEGRPLQRRAAHAELSALHKALCVGFNFKLEDLRCADDFILRPLQGHERRVPLEGGGFAVEDTTTGDMQPEMPPDREPSRLTASVWADQGKIGTAGFNFLICFLGYFLCRFFDLNHRVWNDIKASFKLCRGYTWRTIVYFTLVYNLNYNPFGKGGWKTKKENTLEDWCKHTTVQNKRFRDYAPLIAEEYNKRHEGEPNFVRLPVPETDADFTRILEVVKHMRSFQVCGPSAKLFRWWSWFQCHHDMYSGELWAVKMILEEHLEDDEIFAEDEEDHAGEARADLNAMKKKHGSFKTAYKCITAETVWVARCIFHCVRPLWTVNTRRVTSVCTPADGLAFEVRMSAGDWHEEIEELLDQTLRSADWCNILDLFDADAEEHVQIAVDQVMCLYHYRVQTLRHFCDEPPRSMLKLLSTTGADEEESVTAHDLQWSMLLATEQMEARHQLPRADNPLLLVSWRWHKPVRYLFMLIEKRCLQKAKPLLRRLHAGHDEKKVEDPSLVL